MLKPRLISTGFVCLAVGLIFPGQIQAQGVVAGPNVNMVSGTTWPDGDPFLQRQNEPSIAVSTRNPLHLMAASNDYRTVDLPGLPEGLPIADSWIGVYKSLDGGGSWTSTLLPGYPQDDTAVGLASPIHGLQAAADPVMRAGTHGMFYLSGIVFDRGVTPQSKLFVSRYIDLNNDPAQPLQYIDTVEVASYSFPSNVFIDKPWLAVDVPGGSATTATFYVEQADNPSSPVTQAIECGNLYLAWAEIESIGDTVVEARILSSTSTDCGDTWSSPIVLSDPGTINQGAVVAVSPNPGNVYVAWRQLTGLGVTGDCQREPGYWLHNLDWPSGALPMVIGGVTYTVQQDLVDILASPGTAKGDARYILARQLIATKLNQFDVLDPSGAGVVMAEADIWLDAHPFGGPKPKKADKSAGTALADELEYYNSGLLGPMACGTAPSSNDAILVTASTNSGGSFDPPSLVRSLQPFEGFDQATTEWSFRTTAYPTMTVDVVGRIYVAWSERGDALPTGDPDPALGDSRIMVGTSLYPFSASPWTDVNPIDQPEVPGHQIQPSMTFVNDHLFLVYNDFRKDYSGVFDRFVMDLMTPTQPYRHTVDIRAAVAYPGPSPVFTDYSLLPSEPSTQASKYLFMPTIQGGVLIFEQLEFNPPNLPMFKAGTVPFYGDYVDIAGLPFIPDGSGGWTHNTSATVEPTAHAAWTDNRDVVGPPGPDFDWTSFIPPGSGGTSVFDEVTPVPACNSGTDDASRTGMRNQNIYTSRLTTGLYVAVPGNSRPLSTSFQRAFVVFVQNGTDSAKAFSLEILNQPAGGVASFEQFSVLPLTLDEVDLLAYSSASRTVFATSTDPTATIAVQVSEIDPSTRLPVTGGLAQTILINPDPSNPGPSDSTLLAGEVYNPAVLNPAVYNPAVYNPAVLNPAVFNPAVFNPAVFNPAVFNDAVLNYSVDNPAVFNPAVLNPAVYNPAVFNPAVFNQAVLAMSLMNPAVFNPAVLNPAVFNPAVLNPAVFNPAVFNPAVLNPAVLNPAVFNPAVFNPAVLNPAVMNPAVLNPAVYNTTFADGSTTDFNLIAANTGNATSAYSLNLNLLNQMLGFQYQLMVYRIYFTPVANDCELTEAAQQELLVNDLDPNLSGYLLDPYSDATFYLNPGDYAVMTLRITPDPLAPVPGDPSNFNLEDLSAGVVAQGVNPADAANGESQPPASAWLAPSLAPLVIGAVSLPDGVKNLAYPAQALPASGGQPPYTWSLAPGSGPLPLGMSLSASGVIDGTPTVDGTFNFTVRVTDFSQIDERSLSLTIAPSTLTFVAQPGSTTAGQPIPAFSVRVADDTNTPLPGVTVDLAINTYGCSTASMVPAVVSAITDPLGIATFFGVSIDRGGAGYTFQVTALTKLAESAPFNLVGFCETATMGTPRVIHTGTRLADGRVLFAGGYSAAGTPSATAELYDPFVDTMSPVPGGMVAARGDHTATLLSDGRVLIAGGLASGVPLGTAEIYDPVTNGFSSTGSMAQLRQEHTATLLPDGRVLVVGGNAFPLTSELYDPTTGTFGPAAAISTIRLDHTATLLLTGQVLIAGGNGGASTAQNTVEIYNPATDTFTAPVGSNMSFARMEHSATLLTDGRVLMVGGVAGSGAAHTSAEIFDPATSSFTSTGSLGTGRARHDAVLLSNGTVLVIAGTSDTSDDFNAVASVEIYDPVAGAFAATDGLTAPQFFSTSTLLSNGKVLVAGGFEAPVQGVLATTQTYWPISGETLWTRQFGTASADYAWAVSADGSGLYVAGHVDGTLPGQSSSGGRDAFVRKYDRLGNEVWTRQFGTTANEEGLAISVDASGVYVAGSTNGTLPGQTSSGGQDAFVRKYDLLGGELWTRQFGTGENDNARAVSVDVSGVYVAGSTNGTLPGQTGGGSRDAYLRKYDLLGNELWTRQFGTTLSDEARAVSVGSDGVYVVGITHGTLLGQVNFGGQDAYVRKYDLSGNELWTRQFGTDRPDYAWALSVDASGVYVGGYTSGGVLPGQISSGGADAYVRKYDVSGTELWTRQFGSTSSDNAEDISAGSSGVYVVGHTSGTLPGQVSSGNRDVFARKYDVNGKEIWTRQFGSALGEYGIGVSADVSGVYVAGETAGNLPGQTGSGSLYDPDAFLVKLVP